MPNIPIGQTLQNLFHNVSGTAGHAPLPPQTSFLQSILSSIGDTLRMGERSLPFGGPEVKVPSEIVIDRSQTLEPVLTKFGLQPDSEDALNATLLDYALRNRIISSLRTGVPVLPGELKSEAISSLKSEALRKGFSPEGGIKNIIDQLQELDPDRGTKAYPKQHLKDIYKYAKDLLSFHHKEIRRGELDGPTLEKMVEKVEIMAKIPGRDLQDVIDLRDLLLTVRSKNPPSVGRIPRNLDEIQHRIDLLEDSLYVPKKGVQKDRLLDLKILLRRYQTVPDELTAHEITRKAEAMVQSIVSQGGRLGDYIDLKDLGPVQVDPLTGEVFRESVQDLLSYMLTARMTPALNSLKLLTESIAKGESIYSLWDDDSYKLVASYLGQDQAAKRSLDKLYRSLRRTLRTDEVMGAAMNTGDDMISSVNSAQALAQRVETISREKFRQVFGLKEGEPFPRDVMEKLASAIEHNDQQLMRDLKNRYPGIEEAVGPALAIQALLERHKLISPELKNTFLESYFIHRFPWLLRFLNKGATGTLEGSTEKLFSEFRRRIPTLSEAKARSEAAETEVRSKGLTPLEYIYKLKTRSARAARLGVTPEKADKILGDLLLKDPIVDVPTLLREQILATFRASSVRHMLSLMSIIQGPEGLALLIPAEQAKTALAKVRLSPLGMLESGSIHKEMAITKPYVPLSEIPGYRWAEFNGKAANAWYVHPQVADFLLNYMTYKPQTKGGMKVLMELWSQIRGLGLMGSPLSYFWQIMSNMGIGMGDMMLANAFPAIGEQIRTDRFDYLLDMIRHGLQPQTLLRYIKEVPEVALRELDPVVLEQVYGAAGPKAEGVSSLLNLMTNLVKVPVETALGVDALANRHTLFSWIMDSMIAAHMYHTQELWERRGAEWIAQFGGDLTAAYAEAKRVASDIVNRKANSLPMYLSSDTLRKNLYFWFSTPQIMHSRITTMVGMFDRLIEKIGGRSLFARWSADPVAKDEARKRMENLFWGGILNGLLFTSLFSYLISGRSNFTNPPDKIMHVQVADDAYGNEIYMLNPFFATFRPFIKAVAGRVEEGTWDAAKRALFSLIHPGWTLLGMLATGKDYMGRPILPEAANFRQVVEFLDFMKDHLINTQELLGESSWPVEGYELSPGEHIAIASGSSVSKYNPIKRLSGNLAKRAQYYEITLREKGYKEVLKAIDAGLDTEEGQNHLQKAIDTMYVEGIKIDDPELAKVYTEVYGRPYMVFNDLEVIRRMLIGEAVPFMEAVRKTKKLRRPQLLEEMEEYEQKQEGDVYRQALGEPKWLKGKGEK